MKQKATKKRMTLAPILCAAGIIALLLIYFLLFLFPLSEVAAGSGMLITFCILGALMLAAVIVGVLLALRQRLQEIKGGEEDDARKY